MKEHEKDDDDEHAIEYFWVVKPPLSLCQFRRKNTFDCVQEEKEVRKAANGNKRRVLQM